MKRLVQITVSFSVLLAASRVLAQDGIPQMDQTWYPNQLLWLAISFTLLFIVVSTVIAPSIRSVLHTRESAIRHAIAEAEHARAQAESSRSQATSASQSARSKAMELITAAQVENSRNAANELSKLDHELAKSKPGTSRARRCTSCQPGRAATCSGRNFLPHQEPMSGARRTTSSGSATMRPLARAGPPARPGSPRRQRCRSARTPSGCR